MTEIIKRKQEVEKVKNGLIQTNSPEEKVRIDNSTLTLSTGSTLLDLAISGTEKRGGGIPGGILVEIFGPSGWGKTTILGEICASAQFKGGFAMIGDAERRMTPTWIKKMGVKVGPKNLRQPHTIDDIEDLIFNTPETGDGVIDVTGVDSIASLISSAEIKTTKVKQGEEYTEVQEMKKDKRGSAKAKDLHSLCRRAKIEIAKNNRLIVFTNQIQDVQTEGFGMSFGPKEKTPGGHAVPFYSSLRLRVGPSENGSTIKKKVKIGQKEVEEQIGIRSGIYIFKSSIDIPYRKADVCTLFDYGVDDVRANLEYIKKMTGSKKYWAYSNEFSYLAEAIEYIEKNDLEGELREATIDLWEEIQSKFKVDRKEKVRW